MGIFLSYTLRDGVMTPRRLARLANHAAPFGRAYVDILHNDALDPQSYVMEQLASSDVVLACRTPGYDDSPWARLELHSAAANGISVLEVPIDRCMSDDDVAAAMTLTLQCWHDGRLLAV